MWFFATRWQYSLSESERGESANIRNEKSLSKSRVPVSEMVKRKQERRIHQKVWWKMQTQKTGSLNVFDKCA